MLVGQEETRAERVFSGYSWPLLVSRHARPTDEKWKPLVRHFLTLPIARSAVFEAVWGSPMVVWDGRGRILYCF